MENRVKRVLNRVTQDERLLLAVSGGGDSVAMLKWFAERTEWRRRITVAHVNHGLRSDAEAVAALVKDISGKYGVEFVDAVVNVPAELAQRSESIEACARRLRYDALERLRAENRCAYLITAHTLDDDAETVLMKLLLDSSWFECTGIPEQRERILRPFLNVSRAELRGILDGQDTVDNDPMNLDRRYLRVQSRTIFAGAYANGSAGADRIAAHGKHVRDTVSLTTGLVNAFNNSRLTSCPDPLRGLECLPKNLYLEDLDFIAVERAWLANSGSIESRLKAPTRRRVAEFLRSHDRRAVLPLPNGCSLHRAGRKFWFASESIDSIEQWTTISQQELSIPCPFKGQSEGSLEFSAQNWQARCWRSGDRFKPLNRRTRKISDWLADAGIHPAVRAAWPVISNHEEIIAVPGLGVHERYANLKSSGVTRITWKAITSLDQQVP